VDVIAGADSGVDQQDAYLCVCVCACVCVCVRVCGVRACVCVWTS
jgi:hypothetical protein